MFLVLRDGPARPDGTLLMCSGMHVLLCVVRWVCPHRYLPFAVAGEPDRVGGSVKHYATRRKRKKGAAARDQHAFISSATSEKRHRPRKPRTQVPTSQVKIPLPHPGIRNFDRRTIKIPSRTFLTFCSSLLDFPSLIPVFCCPLPAVPPLDRLCAHSFQTLGVGGALAGLKIGSLGVGGIGKSLRIASALQNVAIFSTAKL